jgi:hypothetical protein
VIDDYNHRQHDGGGCPAEDRDEAAGVHKGDGTGKQ